MTHLYVERTVPDTWKDLERELNICPTIARILSARGVTSKVDTELQLKHLLPPDGLDGIQIAGARLVHAIRNDELILIAGDFDADGATSSALCVSMLRAFGAKHVDFVVPDRLVHGYGLSKKFVQTFLPRQPKVVVTVDNGISSVEGVAFARDNGVDTIITDHHLPPDTLPSANAIVNPQVPASSFDSAPAGVGVAFYLMCEVRRQLRALDHFLESDIEEPNVASWLDLVAIGTVADLVPLDRNNRVLVWNGLRRIRGGNVRPGVKALCQSGKVDMSSLDDQDIGFRIGPRINAAGRLQDMSIGIQALLAEDMETANRHVSALSGFNQKRRQLQGSMTDVAFDVVDNREHEVGNGICVYEEAFHEGVVGLVASRLSEKFNRPSVVFAHSQDKESGLLKGSARSIVGIHIRDVLADVAARYPHLMPNFGGHAMAAGLQIHKSSFERFATLFDQAVGQRAADGAFDKVTMTDGELSADEHTVEFVRDIEKWGPWGQHFERPLFHGTFDVVSERLVGQGKHLKLVLKKEGRILDAIQFRSGLTGCPSVEIAYRIENNEYRGRNSVQLLVEKLNPVRN